MSEPKENKEECCGLCGMKDKCDKNPPCRHHEDDFSAPQTIESPSAPTTFPPQTPDSKDWEHGRLTFDEIRSIIETCDVKIVEMKQDYLTISFAPKNATGEAWRELKEKMLRIIVE